MDDAGSLEGREDEEHTSAHNISSIGEFCLWEKPTFSYILAVSSATISLLSKGAVASLSLGGLDLYARTIFAF